VLDEGIKGLVVPEPEIQVAITAYVDPETFFEDVAHILPDVIVMGAISPLDWTQIPELLHGISSEKALRLIVLRLDDNLVEVYDKQCLKTTRNEDLIPIITNP
jgi:hypothetical protein